VKRGWKCHTAKNELQKSSMFYKDTVFHTTFFFHQLCTLFSHPASQTNWGNKIRNTFWLQILSVWIHILGSGPHMALTGYDWLWVASYLDQHYILCCFTLRLNQTSCWALEAVHEVSQQNWICINGWHFSMFLQTQSSTYQAAQAPHKGSQRDPLPLWNCKCNSKLAIRHKLI
jgi:hypothetical protein